MSSKQSDTLLEEDPHTYPSLTQANAQKTNSTKPYCAALNYAAMSLVMASQMVGSGICLSLLGPSSEAASGIIGPLQGFVCGTAYGFVLNTGKLLSETLIHQKSKEDKLLLQADGQLIEELDNEHRIVIGHIIKTSWLVSTGLALICSVIFLMVQLIMPHLVERDTAKAVDQYFLAFLGAVFSELMIGNIAMIMTLIEQDSITPLCLFVAYRWPALIFSFIFSKLCNMGSTGVGLGPTVVGLIGLIPTYSVFFKKVYQPYQLLDWDLSQIKKYAVTYWTDGKNLSLQRITEWFNMLAITLIVGILDNSSLQALAPSIMANTLIALMIQGLSQYVFMIPFFSKTKAEVTQAFWLYNGQGVGLTLLLSLAIYVSRQPIIHLFLGQDAPYQQQQLASHILLLMLLGLIPDSVRIITGGILRGYQDLVLPPVVNWLMMSVGIVIGAVIPYQQKAIPLLVMRAVTIALAAGYNTYRLNKKCSAAAEAANGYMLLGGGDDEEKASLSEEKANQPALPGSSPSRVNLYLSSPSSSSLDFSVTSSDASSRPSSPHLPPETAPTSASQECSV